MFTAILLAAAFAANTGSILAQAPARENAQSQPQEHSQQIVVHSVEGAGTEELVTGVPYTATIVIDSTQTLGNGSHITHHSTQQVARDSAGRTRRELQITNVGTLQVSGPSVVLIYDPVTQLEYTLDPVQHTAQVNKARAITVSGDEREQPSAGGAQNRRLVRRESLGTQTIDGLSAEGTRVTATIPARLIGNEQPLLVSVEIWYSRDLHAILLRKRTDPMTGDSTYRLTDIHRGEPDPSLFRIPPDYKKISTGDNGLGN